MSSIGYCCAYVTPTATIVEAMARNIQKRLLIEISRGAKHGDEEGSQGAPSPGYSGKLLLAHLVALLLPHHPVTCGTLLSRCVARCGYRPLHDLAIGLCQLLRPELVGQLVDRPGELERQLVAFVDRRAGVHSDVERLVERHKERDRVLHLQLREHLAVDCEHARPALA